MRQLSSWLGAILISTMRATRLLAADAPDCSDCAVANAVATALQEDDRTHSGWRAGGGYWTIEDIDLFLHERAIEDPGNPLDFVGAGVLYRSAGVEGWRRQFGIAIGFAEFAAPFQRAFSQFGIGVAGRETIYGLSYRVEVSEGFAVQSDVHFIRNPGMNAAIDSSWTIGLRFEIGAR